MATTAMVFIGFAHPNHGGIEPTHLIRLTENSRPALILQSFDDPTNSKVIIPTLENTVNDIYLMVSVFILNKVIPPIMIDNPERNSMYDVLDEMERFSLYEETKKVMQESNIKLVFNILENSLLFNQTEIIKTYPCDFEITLSVMKKESSVWAKEYTSADIWEKWEEHYRGLNIDASQITRDGKVNPARFNNKHRVLFVLKESNRFPNGSLSVWLSDGPKTQMWHNVARWAAGVLENFPDYKSIEKIISLKDAINQIAIINLKKKTGGHLQILTFCMLILIKTENY